VSHVEFSVINYDESIKFYDKMFGWLGYASLWTLDVGHRSTYYLARPPVPHSFIGIQPSASDQPVDHRARSTGIHHVALWARSQREVDQFYREFLLKEEVVITDAPAGYPQYGPGYYAVFFLDPSGIRWELAYIPRANALGSIQVFQNGAGVEKAASRVEAPLHGGNDAEAAFAERSGL